MPNVIPTKGNLMAIKKSLTLADLGFELMDRKRNILIREIMGMIGRAEALQARIDTTFSAAYAALQSANITLGQNWTLAETVDVDESVTIRFRSVMGVELPMVTGSQERQSVIPFGFALTNSALDEAMDCFLQVKELSAELAEVETGIYRLAVAIKKTQKRANALQNIIIPGFIRDVKHITDALEEKEREEFSRLKIIKQLTNN